MYVYTTLTAHSWIDPGLNIMVGYQPFSKHAQHMTCYKWHLPVNSNQHKAAMAYLKVDLAKAKNKPVTSSSPIGCSLMNMDATTRERMKRKFDIRT